MKIKVLICLILILALLSCSPSPINQNLDKDNDFEIPELKSYYELLLKDAQGWSSDAYLYEVDIPIGKRPWALSALFYSTTKDKESLRLVMDLQMTTSMQRIDHQFDIIQLEPILPSHWKIGSQAALNTLLTENADVINDIHELCGSLKLSRVPVSSNSSLVWWLNFYECGTQSINYSYLDPITGKIVTP